MWVEGEQISNLEYMLKEELREQLKSGTYDMAVAEEKVIQSFADDTRDVTNVMEEEITRLHKLQITPTAV